MNRSVGYLLLGIFFSGLWCIFAVLGLYFMLEGPEGRFYWPTAIAEGIIFFLILLGIGCVALLMFRMSTR